MPDAVTHWNDVLLDVIRQIGGPPGPIARGGAMMHGAVYDAVNSIVPTHEPYLVTVAASSSASRDSAIAHAAHDTLAAAFPGTTVDLAGELSSALTGSVPRRRRPRSPPARPSAGPPPSPWCRSAPATAATGTCRTSRTRSRGTGGRPVPAPQPAPTGPPSRRSA